MPMYKMDKSGNVYESNPVRADGSGFSRLPYAGEVSSMTLGNPHARAEKERRRKNTLEAAFNAAQDHAVSVYETQKNKIQNQKRVYEEMGRHEGLKLHNQQKMIYEAALQGLGGTKHIPTKMSGNGLTADGSMGKTEDQKQREYALFFQFAKDRKGFAITPEHASIPLNPREQESHSLSKLMNAKQVVSLAKQYKNEQAELAMDKQKKKEIWSTENVSADIFYDPQAVEYVSEDPAGPSAMAVAKASPFASFFRKGF